MALQFTAIWHNTVMCTIKGCDNKPIAKGLCSKHYMRLRRTGKTDERKPGRPPEPNFHVEHMKTHGVDWSQRTFARYARAMDLLSNFHIDDQKAVIDAAKRPSGSLNVVALLEGAQWLYNTYKHKIPK